MFVLPTDAQWARFSISGPLDGEIFTLHFTWNTRDSRWYMTIFDANAVELATSVPLVVDVPLLRKFASPALPSGQLMAFDATGNGEEIAEQEDLGVRVVLVYLDQAEVEALG